MRVRAAFARVHSWANSKRFIDKSERVHYFSYITKLVSIGSIGKLTFFAFEVGGGRWEE